MAPQPNRSAVQALIEFLAALVGQYHAASASLAATYFEDERDAAGIRQRSTVPIADPPPAEQLQRSLGWATRDLADEAVDLDAVLTRTEGAATRITLAAGRNTIAGAAASDPTCTGWVRIAEPDACAFCALLSTRLESPRGRGGAYRSEQTALFRGASSDSYHSHCRCSAQAVFRGQEFTPDAHVRAWADLYRDSTAHAAGADKLTAFRSALAEQRAQS